MREALKQFGVAAALVLLPSLAFAQGTLTGTVRDASGAVLPGVTVEATSPVLIEKVRSVVTDGAGIYRIVDLNPGTYSVTATLPGFATVKRDGIALGGSGTVTIPIEMRVGTLEETITVTGETPVVDVQSVRRETVLNSDIIAAIPATRAVGSLLNATPGITVDNNGLAPTPTMTFFSARGGQTNEGRMTINGMTVAAAFNGGGVSSYIYDSVNADEVSVVVNGGLGETDIGGPVMNLIPRAGGNDFRGSACYNSAGNWSKGNNLDDRLRAAGIPEPPGIIGSYDFSGSYGGPIKRDKLWFFGSYRKLDTSTAVEGIFANANTGDASRWDWRQADGVAARQLQGRTMYMGRLTTQVSERHRISFNHEYQTRCEGAPLRPETDGCHTRDTDWIGLGSTTQSPEAATTGGYFDFPYYVTQALWTAPMTGRLLLEGGFTRFSYYHAGGPGGPAPDGIFDELISVTEQSTAINPATGLRFAPRANYVYRSIPTYQDNYGNPNNWRASMSYVTGSHNAKVGYQGSYLVARSKFVTPDSRVSYRVNQGVPNQVTVRLPDMEQNAVTKSMAFFVQDTWTRGRLTLQGALRYDRATSFSPAEHNGTTQTSRFNPTPITFERVQGVNAYNDLTPRMGVAYDVFGTGRTAVKFNLGHYLDAATNDSIYTRNNPSSRTVRQVARNWTDVNRNFAVDCDVLNPAAQTVTGGDICGALTGEDLNFGRAGTNLRVNEALLAGWGIRENDWQWGVNVQQELMPRVSLDVGYARRWWQGFTVTDDLARGPGDFERWTITAPADSRLPGGGGYPLTFYTQTAAAAARPASQFVTLAKDFGEYKERWHGVDVTLNARLRNGLIFQAGTSTGRKLADRCDVFPKIDSPAPNGNIVAIPTQGAATSAGGALWDAGSCFSKEKFLTTLRGLATYTVPRIDVQVSATMRSQPGLEKTAVWQLPNSVVQTQLGRLPPGALATGITTVSLLDNDAHRLYGDRRTQIDMRFAKIVRIGPTRADIGFDLGNLLNTNYATTYEGIYQFSANNTLNGGTWDNPTNVVTPRFVRVNFTVNF